MNVASATTDVVGTGLVMLFLATALLLIWHEASARRRAKKRSLVGSKEGQANGQPQFDHLTAEQLEAARRLAQRVLQQQKNSG